MKKNKINAIILAISAAVFYAINVPFSKLLLSKIPPIFMAGFLYLGAGLGIGILYLFKFNKEEKSKRLSKKDMPYTVGMVVLDIAAPIFLMIGIKLGSSSGASLIGNFEIVATTLIALIIFKENVSLKLWAGIVFITFSTIILSFNNEAVNFSYGSIFVVLATICWGLENNCTRKISEKSTYEIVLIKGMFSGGFSVVIAFLSGEGLPQIKFIIYAMALGFIAYGLSIFMYIKAQSYLGASKTSAFYSIAPFVGAFLAFAVLHEKLTRVYFVALVIMIIGSAFVVYDTLKNEDTN